MPINCQTSNTSDLLDRFEQRATQSKCDLFRIRIIKNVSFVCGFNFFFLYFEDVSAELLFAYKSLMENRNGSNSISAGDADGRRNVMSAENSKRSSLSNEISK